MATVLRRGYGPRELKRDSWRGLKPAVFALLTSPIVNPAVRFAGKFLPRHIRERLPVAVPFIEYRVGARTVRLLDTKRDQVAKEIYWGRAESEQAWSLVKRLAAVADTFVDVGAYTGLYSLIAAAANPRLRAVAFEILPENFAALKTNVAANDLPIECRLAGLSDRPGTVAMPRVTGSVTHPSSVSLASSFSGGVEVPVDTLDAEGIAGRLLMKVDVEGFEAAVFRGAAETIRRCRPMILCEFLPGNDTAEIADMLRPLGYHFFAVTKHGPEERATIIPDPEARDWLFTV